MCNVVKSMCKKSCKKAIYGERLNDIGRACMNFSYLVVPEEYFIVDRTWIGYRLIILSAASRGTKLFPVVSFVVDNNRVPMFFFLLSVSTKLVQRRCT